MKIIPHGQSPENLDKVGVPRNPVAKLTSASSVQVPSPGAKMRDQLADLEFVKRADVANIGGHALHLAGAKAFRLWAQKHTTWWWGDEVITDLCKTG
jgi:hypothetical protein